MLLRRAWTLPYTPKFANNASPTRPLSGFLITEQTDAILSCDHLCIMDIPCIMTGSAPPPQFLDTGISKLDYIHHSFIDWILV